MATNIAQIIQRAPPTVQPWLSALHVECERWLPPSGPYEWRVGCALRVFAGAMEAAAQSSWRGFSSRERARVYELVASVAPPATAARGSGRGHRAEWIRERLKATPEGETSLACIVALADVGIAIVPDDVADEIRLTTARRSQKYAAARERLRSEGRERLWAIAGSLGFSGHALPARADARTVVADEAPAAADLHDHEPVRSLGGRVGAGAARAL